MSNSIVYKIIGLILVAMLPNRSSKNDALLFSKDNFTVKTKTVNTSNGIVKVVYRAYMHIPYVANPVDKNYQSLNVFVPVRINDKETNTSNAPVYYSIRVGGYMPVNNTEDNTFGNENGNSREDYALVAGMVVVVPGCRGRVNKTDHGTYFGKAPAAIVDLKAAVSYIKHNKGVIPGNVDKIVSVGCSAGGALSALLGASGTSEMYKPYLEEIGAANAPDNVFASVCYSPITDLEHADMAYEWMYGQIPTRSGLVDQSLSEKLKEQYVDYQISLNLNGKDGFGILSADNYRTYLLTYYLQPSVMHYLASLPDKESAKYLAENKWIDWQDGKATFSFDNYLNHVGRMKGLPAFDDFEMRSPETALFGTEDTNTRHFTEFSLSHSEKTTQNEISDELKGKINMMNAMFFILNNNEGCAPNWWLRNGTSDNHTSQTVMINLATALENNNKNVNTELFWDGGHCADFDPEGLINWITEICR
ncbi:MAG: alpha/beta hydrolase [Bacteroidales bacterium]|nr:alpha/beta hydrolase [Bacteroidales bacterium]